MSLLVEPYNKATFDRNQKEQFMAKGEFHYKTREDYLLAHLGLTKPPRRPGGSTPLRSVSAAALSNWHTAAAAQSPAASVGRSPSDAGMSQSRQSARARSESGLSRASGMSRSMGSLGAGPPRARSPSQRSVASSSFQELGYKDPPKDPVIQVMMYGPPLFSPGLCTRASALC
mmetsp:Transcript_103062/g.291943  ORF Transcript_103062/g.291943 Transcript_103062/m.291943 type:complete len:173 (-) Transcript_103062:309-827(-)